MAIEVWGWAALFGVHSVPSIYRKLSYFGRASMLTVVSGQTKTQLFTTPEKPT